MKHERRFSCDPTSVRLAREFVANTLVGVPSSVQDSVAVMVSELATNAVLHAATAFDVRVDRTGARVVVAVSDAGPGDPSVRRPSSSELHGRGLRIVRELSDDWGVRETPSTSGKTVWFSLRTSSDRTDTEYTAHLGDDAAVLAGLSDEDGTSTPGRESKRSPTTPAARSSSEPPPPGTATTRPVSSYEHSQRGWPTSGRLSGPPRPTGVSRAPSSPSSSRAGSSGACRCDPPVRTPSHESSSVAALTGSTMKT